MPDFLAQALTTGWLASPSAERISVPAEDFSGHAQAPGAALLESSLVLGGRGRNSFWASEPKSIWRVESHQPLPQNWQYRLDDATSDRSLFHVLCLSYEAGVEMATGEVVLVDDGFPKITLSSYHTAKQFHHEDTLLKSHPAPASHDLKSRVGSPLATIERPSYERYQERFAKLKAHIHEGDIYQANLTDSWRVRSSERPWEVYRRLRELNPAQYGGYINLGDYQIISSSPERLFCAQGDRIVANPIKGTIAADGERHRRELLAHRLLSSEKDRAEALMIVDLLRNDIGRIATTGSVETPVVWGVEEHSSLIHLVATIIATLKPNSTPSEMITALFPGGSISGAPKRAAIELLRQIENRPRGTYTGSVGYIHGDTVDFNIAIRTIVHRDGLYEVQAGGGIVADSVVEHEFDEARIKARNLIRAIDPRLEP